ncbi:MAG TPA: sugar transferase [Burkholderiales bacterium]|nr:sugar transferase [Burkholderiales bacterium]
MDAAANEAVPKRAHGVTAKLVPLLPAQEARAEIEILAILPDVPPHIAQLRVTAGDLGQLVLRQLAALLILLFISPLLAVFAWIIRSDGGPATFAHYRVGLGGRVFRCLKFRTMRLDAEKALQQVLERDPALRAEWSRNQKLAHDPRVTRFGRWLRELSLDELPQLFNVLRGEMALVGPRPITTAELPRYGPARWHYLSVAPGMTGLWQVSGRNRTTYERRVELDRQYVTGRSAWLDLKILAKTILVVITRDGAC